MLFLGHFFMGNITEERIHQTLVNVQSDSKMTDDIRVAYLYHLIQTYFKQRPFNMGYVFNDYSSLCDYREIVASVLDFMGIEFSPSPSNMQFDFDNVNGSISFTKYASVSYEHNIFDCVFFDVDGDLCQPDIQDKWFLKNEVTRTVKHFGMTSFNVSC